MTNAELKEYVKCARDPVYFLNTYGYVYDITKKQVDRLTCFDYQENMITKFQNNQNNIVLKSRQLGLSVITAGFVVWTLLFKIDQRILIVANDGAAAVRFLSTVKQFMQYLPKLFYSKEDDDNNNTKFLSLKNGNWVKAVASGKQAGRGEALTMLILDEVAFIENADDIWMGAGLALTATKGKCIMISTPFGTGNLYHRTWVASQKNENSFIGTTIHWTEHPVYSIGKELRKDEFGRSYWWSPWYEVECERFNYDRIKISQELDLSFEGSRALVIDSGILNKIEQDVLTKSNPICYFDYTVQSESCLVDDVKTTFLVWEKPYSGGNYILTADVGRGDGSDFSTIQIIDANEVKQVAEYQGKIPPDLFAHMIYKAAKEYNNAYVVIEANSFGLATCLVLKNQLKYNPNRIYHSKSVKKMVNHHWDVNVDENSEIPGFQTTVTTRPLIIASLISYMREGKIEIRSKRIIEEFKTFIYDGPKAQHAPGYHDDLIIALAIALYIRDTEFSNVFASKEFYKSMLDSFTHETSSERNPMKIDNRPLRNSNNQGIDDDLSWLLK